MKKDKKFKVTYVYHEPKTLQEKADQQRRLDQAFDMIFDKIFDETHNKIDK